MARKRDDRITLPAGVHRVRAGGRVYHYWHPGRGTGTAGERVRIAGDPYARAGTPENAEFWRALNRLMAGAVTYPAGSLGELIQDYREDEAFRRLADSTRASYAVHLERFALPDGWGTLDVDALTPMAVLARRNAMADRRDMANQMLAVGRTLFAWAVPLGRARSNPFEPAQPYELDDHGHVPWPSWAQALVLEHAPDDLVRLARLGIATCQRQSDMIRMGPDQRERVAGRNGIWCRPTKTRRKRRAFFIPLAAGDADAIDRWVETPLRFEGGRWGHTVEQHRTDLYLYSPTGEPYTTGGLRQRWNRWLRTERGEALCQQWQAWISEQVRRYAWDIDPEEVDGPTLHGLRGTGILRRFGEGYDRDQIANDVGMSTEMVSRYMRFRDQVEVAAAGRARLKLAKK